MADLSAHRARMANSNQQLQHKKKNLATLTKENRSNESKLRKVTEKFIILMFISKNVFRS